MMGIRRGSIGHYRITAFFASVLLIVSSAHDSLASSDKYRYIISSVSTNDGLSNNTVQAVLQDHYGFIWFGTKDGLDRYDGSNLRHFSPTGGVNENNYVLSLCEDNWGKIWVGTSAGLCVFDPETETETCFNLGVDGLNDIEIPVYQIIKDNDGSLWIPAAKAGFIHIFPESGEVVRLSGSKVKCNITAPRYAMTEKNRFISSWTTGTSIIRPTGSKAPLRFWNKAL